ncbi:MAG: DMT family transporter [Planctomycetia bacterium]|jgi:drug/metabolite transporter (DMT)-like permease
MPIKILTILTVLGMVVETLLMKVALTHWSIGMVGAISRIFTVALLACWVLSRGAGWRRLAPRGAGWWLVLMGFNAIAINLLLFAAMKGLTTATNYALLYRLDIVFVVLIGTMLGLERIGWRELALLPIMLFGVACVAEVRFSELEPHIVGDLMVVGAALGFAVNAFVLRRIFVSMDTEAVALINVSITGLGFLGLMLIRNEIATSGSALADPMAWLWVVLFGVCFAVYLALYYVTLRRLPVWKLRMWMLSVPVIIAIVDAVVWDTRLSVQQGSGMVLVLLGLAGLIWLERNHGFLLRRNGVRSQSAEKEPQEITGPHGTDPNENVTLLGSEVD